MIFPIGKIVGLRGPDLGSTLISQTNHYTTGPFSIILWSADRSLTGSSMGDVGTKIPHLEMVVMWFDFFYPCLHVGDLALGLVRQTLYYGFQYLRESI